MDYTRTQELLTSTGKEVEWFVENYLRSDFSISESIAGIIRYSYEDIGVRLLPFLLRISYEEGGSKFSTILPIAAGIEMIKTSALAIDDVIDNTLLRNTKPSVYAKWGSGLALTSGIFMYSFAFRLIAETLESCDSCANKIGVLGALAQTHEDIYDGQFMDLEFEHDVSITEKQFINMISKTTASFIRVPLVIGAMLWDAPPGLISALSDIGKDIGIAYQLRDDVIDIIGDSEMTGKPKAGDVRDCKMRLPVIHAMRNATTDEAKYLSSLLSNKEVLSNTEMDWVLSLMDRTGSVKYAIDMTKEYCRHATETVTKIETDYSVLAGHLRVVSALISSFEDEN